MFSFYNKFTQRAQSALRLAHEASKEMGHSYVGSEHILLGLIGEGQGIAARALQNAGVDIESLKKNILGIVGQGEGGVPAQGLTPRSKHII